MDAKLAVLFFVLAVSGSQALSLYDDFSNAHREQEEYRRTLDELMDVMMERRGTPLDDLVSFFDGEKGNRLAVSIGQNLEQIGKTLTDYASTGNKADEATFRAIMEQFAASAQQDGRLVTFLQKFVDALHPAAGRR